MPTGDSITEGDFANGGYRRNLGQWFDTAPSGYTAQFVGPKFWGGLDPPYQYYNAAGGNTITNILSGGNSMSPIATVLASYIPDLITLMCGINDLFGDDAATVAARYVNLLAAMRGTRVVAATVLDNQDATTHSRVLAFNALLPDIVADEVAAGGKVVLFDAYSLLGPWSAPNYQDATHPNTTGYAIYAPGWRTPILNVLAM